MIPLSEKNKPISRKKPRNICRFRNCRYLCTRNQKIDVLIEVSGLQPRSENGRRGFEKASKKVLQKFGGFEKRFYLCTTFRSENKRKGFRKMVL